MALEGLKKETRRMGVKGQGSLYGGSLDNAKYKDGVGECGHYDTELENNFCRDEDCRYQRFIKALMDGKAKKMPDGTIVWLNF